MPTGIYIRNKKYESKVCPICGKEFFKSSRYSEVQWNNAIYCSNKCRGFSKRGIPVSEEKRNKLRTYQLGKTGEKAPNWRGGKSFEPYSVDWKKTLKISIRERDKYRCKICGEPQGDEALSVHHIDYNKLNCNPDNLISLCRSCHVKTNYNREKWIEYFNNIL
jgi:hypothetical protein